jgi:hypothetical protein
MAKTKPVREAGEKIDDTFYVPVTLRRVGPGAVLDFWYDGTGGGGGAELMVSALGYGVRLVNIWRNTDGGECFASYIHLDPTEWKALVDPINDYIAQLEKDIENGEG